MFASLLSFAVSLMLTAPADSLLSPRQIVKEAMRAVEAGSAAPLLSRWNSLLQRDSTDRSALLGLATLARLQYDYATAERLYRRVLERGQTPTDTLAVYARLGLAQGLDAQGFGTKAAEELTGARTAAHAARDSFAEAEALLGLSLQRAFTVGIETGLATLDTVEHLVAAQDYDVHVERLRQRAALRGIVGSPGSGTDALEALSLARRSGSHRLLGQALRATAQLLQFEGKRDSSILVLKQAEEAYRRGRDRGQLATALLWHVNALLAVGDLGEANQLAHLALVEGEAAHNGFAAGAAYTALGAITIFLGDYPAATDNLQKAIRLFEQMEDPAGAMKARDYLAVTALAAGDLAGARRQALEVVEWYRRTHESLIEFGAHRNLAIIAMHAGDWDAADHALEDARALARQMKRPLWLKDLTYDDARLALFRGDLPAAERGFRQYLATLDSTQHFFRHDARIRLADLYARRGDLVRSEAEARVAWEELERWRQTLSDSALRVLAFQTSPTEMSDRDASVVRVLAVLAGSGRARESFELAERRRARELADRLSRAWAFQTSSERRTPGAPGERSGPLSAAEIIRLIPDDSTAILEYVTGSLGAPTTLFVLTAGQDGEGLQAFRLAPVDSLKDQIARFEALLQSGEAAGPLAGRLGTALLGRGITGLSSRIRRLVIVPDGPLHQLTFDALHLPNGGFLGQRYAISIAPSAGVLATLWQETPDSNRQHRPMQLLAFGDPAFGDEFPRLQNSAREARFVAQFSPRSVVRLGKDASATYLKHTDLTPYRLLHFATHSLVDDHSSARTALLLAPGTGEDGRVGPAELAALRLDADLVVLSSCRSAGGVTITGEGIQGLTAPIIQAGARAMVATQWEVGDRSTFEFIERLYRHLAAGLAVSDALQAAKLDAIRKGDSPRIWAAFVAVGDPMVRVPLEAPRGRRFWPIWFGMAVVIGILAARYSERARKRRSGEAS
jgi:tetratricopeptide (TPR) repeat protein